MNEKRVGSSGKRDSAFPRGARLGACFVDDVERCFGGATEMRETGFKGNAADSRFSSLGTEAKSYFLRARARGAKQRGKRVVDAANRVEIIFQFIPGVRFYDHPCTTRGQ